jgi:hypothetical protein
MSSVRRLSKSKLISGWQCARRLWLDVYEPDLADYGADAEQKFATGHEVGEAAQNLFPGGVLIGHDHELSEALTETETLLAQPGPLTLFEATFRYDDVLIRADILQRDAQGALRVIEVKAATKLKEYYVIDCAIQLHVVRHVVSEWVSQGVSQGVGDDRIRFELAHINNQFVYQGDGNYEGLLTFVDVTDRASKWLPQVPQLIDKMRIMLADVEPAIEPGPQCSNPFDCPFIGHCAPRTTDYPIDSLPGSKAVKRQLIEEGYEDIREIPVGRLENDNQERVRRVTHAGKPEIDPAAAAILSDLPYPRYYFDCETVAMPVPIWKNTRPYQAYPFQWSCHVEMEDGRLEHCEFLVKGSGPPMRVFAESLIRALGSDPRPVIVYTSYEKGILSALAERFPDIAGPISAIIERLFDLHPLTRSSYYHPDMHGSWSIKAVLPTIAPDLSYAEVGEVTDGMAAAGAYRSMLVDALSEERQAEIRRDLKAYCELDTLAMVRVVSCLVSGTGP